MLVVTEADAAAAEEKLLRVLTTNEDLIDRTKTCIEAVRRSRVSVMLRDHYVFPPCCVLNVSTESHSALGPFTFMPARFFVRGFVQIESMAFLCDACGQITNPLDQTSQGLSQGKHARQETRCTQACMGVLITTPICDAAIFRWRILRLQVRVPVDPSCNMDSSLSWQVR
jgi:hypothetical protein